MQFHNGFILYLEKQGSFFLVVCPCKQREIDFHQQRWQSNKQANYSRPLLVVLLVLYIILSGCFQLVYRKVASRSTSRLVARPRIFWLLMKGKFDPCVLWPLAWDLWPLNSRPVYCSRLYGICSIILDLQLHNPLYFSIAKHCKL